MVVGGAADGTAHGTADGADFVAVYQRHFSQLARVLELAGQDPATAEDIAQESFARALARWRKVSVGANPAGYVYRTAFRLAAKRRPSEPTMPAPTAPGCDTAAAARADVARALTALPERQRACIVCSGVLGYSPTETARMLGIRPSTVRKHLSAARSTLHLELDA